MNHKNYWNSYKSQVNKGEKPTCNQTPCNCMLMDCSVPYWDMLEKCCSIILHFKKPVDVFKLINSFNVMTTAHTLCTESKKKTPHTGICVNITNVYTMKKQFLLILKNLNFKSLPETVTLSTAIFQSRTEVVCKVPAVIDVQLLGAGLQTERVLKAGLKSPLSGWQQRSHCGFLQAWNFTPVYIRRRL